jgi:hypothetical protein
MVEVLWRFLVIDALSWGVFPWGFTEKPRVKVHPLGQTLVLREKIELARPAAWIGITIAMDDIQIFAQDLIEVSASCPGWVYSKHPIVVWKGIAPARAKIGREVVPIVKLVDEEAILTRRPDICTVIVACCADWQPLLCFATADRTGLSHRRKPLRDDPVRWTTRGKISSERLPLTETVNFIGKISARFPE